MKRMICFGSLLLVASCATTPVPKVLTEVKTVEVRVPVRTPCLKAEEIPPHPPYVMRVDADVRGLAAGATAELREWENYYSKVDILLRSCL
jgi:hypothetical protein